MKRRTVIGSPYWMAPEVIQETSCKKFCFIVCSYSVILHNAEKDWIEFSPSFFGFCKLDDGKADIWSLGITLLELCEGNPPHFTVHPMRAIFIISSRPAPTFKEPEKWSPEMVDFLSHCLVKNCETRWTASELLKHPWLRRTVKEIGAHGRGLPVLRDLINDNWDEIERIRCQRFNLPVAGSEMSPAEDDIQHHPSTSPLYLQDPGFFAPHSAHSSGHHHQQQQGAIALDMESLNGSEKSSQQQLDDSTMRTIARANSFGMPATRQQMRNRTLSRSNTPVGTPNRQGSMRRPLYNSSSSNIGMNFNYESDDAAASAKNSSISNNNNSKLARSMNAIETRGESKTGNDDKRDNDFKRHRRPQQEAGGGHGGGGGGDHKCSSELAEEEDYPEDRGSSMMRVGQVSSMARVPAPGSGSSGGEAMMDDMVRVAPATKAGEAPKVGGGFMSALKYFQDEPLPTEAQHGFPTSVLPVRGVEAKGHGGAGSSALASASGAHSSMVRVPTKEKGGGGRRAPSPVLVDEEEVLNELTASEEDNQNLLIKKVNTTFSKL